MSAAAVTLFASNVYFFRNVDYFAAPAEEVPLIHTWSLGIEEQFYVLFPILALLLRTRTYAIAVIAVLAFASFALAQWGVARHPVASFYFLHTRCWELLAGAIIAYLGAPRHPLPRLLRDMLALMGILAIALAYVAYDRSTPFPGVHALAPVFGTALVITFADRDTLVGRALSVRPVAFIGLISYSTYLWHQPLLAFARHIAVNTPSPAILAAIACASFAIGAASWHFVERPFRDRRWLSQRQVFLFSGACTALILCFALATVLTAGFRSRFDARILALVDFGHPWLSNPCHRSDPTGADLAASCVLGDPANVVGVLIGDSHAGAVAEGLGDTLRRQGLGLLQITLNGCPPLRDIYRADWGPGLSCAQFNADVDAFLKSNPKLSHVVVVSRWTRFLEPAGFDNGEGGVELSRDRVAHLEDGRPKPLSEKDSVALIRRKAAEKVKGLLGLGKHVVLVYPVPEVGWEAPLYIARRDRFRGVPDSAIPPASTSTRTFHQRNAQAFEMLDAIGDDPRLSRVHPHHMFCDRELQGRCVFQRGLEALYTDSNHVSRAGAELLAPAIVAAITQREARSP